MGEKYRVYQDYLKHQMTKTLDPIRRQKWLGVEWEMKLHGFKAIFDKDARIIRDSETALCLGARTGQEVKALLDMGIKAIGIDLVPREPLVVSGDVHNLQFPDGSFGFVFSNIFDHVLYPEKLCSEIERVLKPDGHALLHLQLGGGVGDKYTENSVSDVDSSVIKLFKRCNVVRNAPIERNWPAYKGKAVFSTMNWELLLRKRKV